MNYPRVLIVGTSPYNNHSTARALDAYFHFWDHKQLRQIFSDLNQPEKGHCDELYQITDIRILKSFVGKLKDPGIIYKRDTLQDGSTHKISQTIHSRIVKKMYMLGAGHTALTHLIRHLFWRERFWKTSQFLEWIDSFKPECVFVCSSDDFFILNIALFVSERFNIPIVSAISDDYYFNYRHNFNPFYIWYKKSYMKLCKRFYKTSHYSIYISDKIKNKYNDFFSLKGETVYLVSSVARRSFKSIDFNAPKICYFGNIRMGRNKSLLDIANALRSINVNYRLEVYSNEKDDRYYANLKSHPNVIYGGSIPYEIVVKKMSASDITIIVEGFEKKDIDCSRYSLSTKAADSLASGVSIFTYGSEECGIISYMKETNASVVCTKKIDLKQKLLELMYDETLQKSLYDKQIDVYNSNHNINRSCYVSLKIINEAIKYHKKNNI